VYDRWDIWQVDPSGEDDPVCLTAGQGREDEIRFRYVRLDPEQRTVDPEQPLVLSARDHETKASGYYQWTAAAGDDADPELEQLISLDESVAGLRKAKESDAVMFTRSTFQRCPDIWASTLEFDQLRRISRINPQQGDYLWGTAELVRWNADDGQQLDGVLYKPENFDPDKKYPLLVYFYERNSDNLHNYSTPAAGRSIISFSFYVSRGYVLFIPDIPYKVGEPGPSAANSVLPGVRHIVDQGFIDEERIGMQGHSWGGYQTAYLVTVTDMFACAESGAPVSNMTSAYGGIRWGTGMSRMFQYEKTQSRIGGTLWEARDKYIANSPLFFVDKINTPLLILHNDQDTAVPWYQGIELFVALRRLEKPAWMLNYNGDPHWVMSDENRMDFAKRMQQFFDHYLKGDPMPVWMADGVPAVDKGEKFGFEYVEEEEEPESESETGETTEEVEDRE
ncbi:MAG: alpha/beta hydrolase family protein, partial [Pirellulaceae bacterium]